MTDLDWTGTSSHAGRSRPGAANELTENYLDLVSQPFWLKVAGGLLAVAVFLSGYNILRVGGINLTFSDAALFASLAVFLLWGRLNATPFGVLTPLWLFGLALMLGGLFVSTLINGDPSRWVVVSAQYIAAFLILPVVLTAQSDTVIRRLVVIYVFGITISEAIGITAILLFDFSDTRDLLGNGFITGNGRLGAMSGEPNPNGAVIAFALPMLVYSWRKKLISGALSLGCAAILLWGLVLSASFTGFAASMIALLVACLMIDVRAVARLAVPAAVGIAALVSGVIPLSQTFQERVSGALVSGHLDQAGTFTSRSELIAEAWRFAEGTLLIGFGVDRYREISLHGQPVHDLHLLIWTEGGGVAFAGLLIILVLLLALAATRFRKMPTESIMAMAVVCAFMVYTFSIPHMYSRFWLLPVLLALSTMYSDRSQPDQ